ncbi:MAG: NAD(+) synthase [Verrucomicrobia bacterium]|nr:NAD(+) synthase [Verrucomicrobiota bacterium]MBU4247153.1 NAD(+) synthase [Verrucomicrobiota bacterium]MBU4290994.1 NAD(+) synthase [Verrucomicrobiota bacterium]MBU4429154.1 NAD(+) synthase [Verrucomicrobiota bacterium]MBU4496980.1 NAD(+) synthase [Verrucomicrobiota bacterium]
MTVIPGQPEINTAAILCALDAARKVCADVVVFPEMAIPGYLIGDGWERDAFLRECEACGERLREASDGIIIVFGNVAMDWARCNEDGRVRKYNALFVAQDRRFIGPQNGPYPFVIKILQPNYRAFDESRYFYDLRKLALESGRPLEEMIAPVAAGRWTLGCVVCEDAWDENYSVSPLRMLTQQPVDLLINISCSPFTFNKNQKRGAIFSAHAAALGKPLVYVNNVGIQNDGKTICIFDGSSSVYDGAGGCVSLPAFEEGVLTQEIPLNGAAFGVSVELKDEGIGEIYRALLYGVRAFLAQCEISRVIVGVSGGIDSAVVAALFSRLLDREQLLLANLPGPFTSPTTVALARRLAGDLRCYYTELPIGAGVSLTKTQVDGLEITSRDGALKTRLQLTDFMVENVQARDRSARVLAALAAAFGGVFTCNANKAETTVGYATLYGDLAGFLAPIADLWKGEVYQLARYLNEQVFQREVIPQGCFDLAPSAELSPAQDVDQGKGDPLIYPYHDRLFASWVERWVQTTPEEILEWYQAGDLEKQLSYEGKVADIFPDARSFVADLERWWKQYQGMGVVKRVQAPPILAVKRRTFGFDHRESQMTPWFSRRYQELKALILQGSL